MIERGAGGNPASAPIERRKMTPAPDTDESVARARTRDFQTRHGESFWDISQEEFDAYAKPIEAEKINKGEKHHV